MTMEHKVEKVDKLNDLIQEIPHIKNKEAVFDLTCRISAITGSCTDEELQEISFHNNLYVGPIWNVFHNDLFFVSLKTIMSSPYEDMQKGKLLEEQQTIQLFLRLSFFMVSVLAPVLREDTVFFLRRHFGVSLKHIYNELSDMCNMHQLLFALEDINFDAKYRFLKKFPITLDLDFLSMNLISSRILVGFLLMSSVSYWTLPQLFEDVAKDKRHPGTLFRIARRVKWKVSGYHKYDFLLNEKFFSEERKEGLKVFVSLLRDKNIEDLMFLIVEVGPDYDPRRYEKSIEQKIEFATYIREKVQKKFETLDVFIENGENSGRWSNKAFLNTVVFFSALESIKQARDVSWKINTFNYFLNRWLGDMNEIVNYYDIENSETIVVFVEGLSDKMILENAYEKLHPKHSDFIFYHVGGRQELFKKINAAQINDFERKSIGIFDFDEAYNDFNGLRKADEGTEVSGFCEIQGEEQHCLFRVREDRENQVFAILLPVPESRKGIASREFEGKSLLSIEMLFEDELLKRHGNLEQKSLPGGSSVSMFVGDKVKFAEKTKEFDKSEFENFKPLFQRLFAITKEQGSKSQTKFGLAVDN